MLKRILAIIGIIIIVSLYICTLLLAILGNENTLNLFYAAIIATIVVPVLIYVYQMLCRLQDKK